MMQQWFKCAGCGKDILYGTNPCPYCKSPLAWSQQGSIVYIPPIGESQQQAVPSATNSQSANNKTNPLVTILAIIGGCVLLLGTCAICIGNSSTKSSLPSLVSNSTQTPVDNSIKAGMYKAGKDIQAGEYILFASSSMDAYFQVTKDSSGTLHSIITNDNFGGNRYIKIADGQYIEFRGAKMFPVNDAPVLRPIDGKYPEGMYKVGRDIIAGEYKVVSDGGTSYLEVAIDSSGSLMSIVTNDNFIGEKYVTIKDGQYIKLNGCHIVE
jgi:hypothetical protein